MSKQASPSAPPGAVWSEIIVAVGQAVHRRTARAADLRPENVDRFRAAARSPEASGNVTLEGRGPAHFRWSSDGANALATFYAGGPDGDCLFASVMLSGRGSGDEFPFVYGILKSVGKVAERFGAPVDLSILDLGTERPLVLTHIVPPAFDHSESLIVAARVKPLLAAVLFEGPTPI